MGCEAPLIWVAPPLNVGNIFHSRPDSSLSICQHFWNTPDNWIETKLLEMDFLRYIVVFPSIILKAFLSFDKLVPFKLCLVLQTELPYHMTGGGRENKEMRIYSFSLHTPPLSNSWQQNLDIFQTKEKLTETSLLVFEDISPDGGEHHDDNCGLSRNILSRWGCVRQFFQKKHEHFGWLPQCIDMVDMIFFSRGCGPEVYVWLVPIPSSMARMQLWTISSLAVWWRTMYWSVVKSNLKRKQSNVITVDRLHPGWSNPMRLQRSRVALQGRIINQQCPMQLPDDEAVHKLYNDRKQIR